ncbi:glycoside hydrolase superfamily [Aspergillus egyptiacus]|nr:glycoside hydrolase superfamily [Aspergillus egyptiacus]
MQLLKHWWLLAAFVSTSSASAFARHSHNNHCHTTPHNGTTPTPTPTPKPRATTEGIDLLEIHLPVDWKDSIAAGVEFVYVKATEGIDYRNLRFPSQIGRAPPEILRGAVHFAKAAESSGAEQADFFIEHGGNWTPDGRTLPGVLEMEGNIAGKLCHGMTPMEITDWMAEFSVRYEERTGRAPMFFLSAEWWAQCGGNNGTFGAGHDLWLANWGEEMGVLPVGWKEARFWQYAWSDGTGGQADLFLGSSEELLEFAMGR